MTTNVENVLFGNSYRIMSPHCIALPHCDLVPRCVELQAESDGTTGVACCETFSVGFVGMTTYQDCFDWFVKDVENDPSIMASNVGNNSMYQKMIAAFPHEMDRVGVKSCVSVD
jgi:hypothetical protein